MASFFLKENLKKIRPFLFCNMIEILCLDNNGIFFVKSIDRNQKKSNTYQKVV